MPAAARAPEVAAALKLPFAEQIAFFRGKLGNLVPTAKWTDLWQQEHDVAFMVAGAAKADLLADLAEAVDKAIADGETIQQFRRRFLEIIQRHGWAGFTGDDRTTDRPQGGRGLAWRTRVIYETNLLTSYAAGRRAQLEDGGYTHWMYKHSDFVQRPRPHHVALNGIVRPKDDPFWQTHYPPNGWGCRCRVLGVRSPAQARRLGGDWDKPLPSWAGQTDPKTGAPVGVDKGFGYMPGGSVVDRTRALRDKLTKLPTQLANALSEDVSGYELKQAIRKAGADVLRLAKGDAQKTEYATLIDQRGRVLWTKRGGESYVDFTDAETVQMRGGVLIHNHPSDLSLSMADLLLARDTGLSRIYAFGHEGSIYAARVPNRIGVDSIIRTRNSVEDKVYEHFRRLIRSGKISVQQAERYHHHAINMTISRLGIIKYSGVVRGGTPGWVHDVVRKIADEMRGG